VVVLHTACGEEEPVSPTPNIGTPNDSTAAGGGNNPDTGKKPDDDNTAGGSDTPTETEETTSDARLEVYQKIYAASDIYVEGDFVIIETNGRPDHKSPYYVETSWEGELHEAYNGSNDQFRLNPNRIGEFTYTFKIPLNPEEATRHQATPMGAIGVSLNGVPFYNQYAAPDEPLTNEINSFDQYNGHPTGNANYHYHIEPLYLTETVGKDVLLGFLLDGFPVYGPTESGKLVSENDLDEYHGHTHATSDYPDGIYHYHITSNDPYINGNGYFGTPGTFSQ
ncbi:YHYH protein, partial [Tunicatimonas sp.]|uniref:YHYH protein n=1 Tax=Tunicatimonas sp. TaxID=1940096 RepID=UPI003C712421